jgi:hypothetical protein
MGDAARAQHSAMFSFGHDGSRSYEERHRLPGDWDAWVSQGKFAIHENEHLVHSDGGVKLFRKQLREGIKAVKRGQDPKGVLRDADGPIRSYGANLCKPWPSRPADAERWELLKSFSRDAIAATLKGQIEPLAAAAE